MSKLKTLVVIVLIVGAANLPLLHQDLPAYQGQPGYRTHFSLFDALDTDIAEHCFLTPSFIKSSIRDILRGDF